MYVPNTESQENVAILARKLVPSAEEVTTDEFEFVNFFDSGSNFARVVCPCCENEVPMDWWQKKMNEDFNGHGFDLAPAILPCCGASTTLNKFCYDWPQAFARFCCTIRNPGISTLENSSLKALEGATGCPLCLILRHL